MKKLPKELIDSLMLKTGASREEILDALSIFTQGIGIGDASEQPTQTSSDDETEYDEQYYPHYLPSDNLKKYTIRVTLVNANPVIWRQFVCPSNISLRHFAELILALMGWGHEHLNQIQAKSRFYQPHYQRIRDPFRRYDVRDQEDYTLADILCRKGQTIKFEYDFGDSWMHEIRLSSIEHYAEDETQWIRFVDGKGDCPPEDCGGVYGYCELLELLEKQKAHKQLTAEELERLDWYGIEKDYDPEYLNLAVCSDICEIFDDVDPRLVITQDVTLGQPSQSPSQSPMPPHVTLPDNLLELAFNIRNSQPWINLCDADVFAVKMNDKSLVYVVIMGHGGVTHDILFFHGAAGFQTYIEMSQNSTSRDVTMLEYLDSLLWGDFLSLSFENSDCALLYQSEITEIDAWVSNHGFSVENIYPVFRRYPLHCDRMPVYDENDVPFLTEVLEAVNWLCHEIDKVDSVHELGFEKEYIVPSVKGGKVVPMIVKTADGYALGRTKLPGKKNTSQPFVLPEKELQPLRFLPKRGDQYCWAIHNSSVELHDSNTPSPYNPVCMYTFWDLKIPPKLLVAKAPLDLWESNIMHQYVKAIRKAGCLPSSMLVFGDHTYMLMKDFCKRLNIKLKKSDPIPVFIEMTATALQSEAEKSKKD